MSDVPSPTPPLGRHPVQEPEGYPLPPFEWDDWDEDPEDNEDDEWPPARSGWPTIEDWWSV